MRERSTINTPQYMKNYTAIILSALSLIIFAAKIEAQPIEVEKTESKNTKTQKHEPNKNG